jgi:hypothetical protein
MLAESGPAAPSTPESPQRKPRAWGEPLLMVTLIAVFHVLRGHWNHVSGSWPYLLLLACPLMYLFHGHGDHAKHDSHRPGPWQE